MKSILIVLPLFIFIVACGNPEQPMVDKDGPKTTSLTVHDLLDAELIASFLKNGEIKGTLAQSLFMRGVDAYENEKQLDSARFYFEQSLMTQPSEKAYFQWAKVLKEQHEYTKSVKAFHLAEKMGYEPFSSILFELSCIYSMQKDFDKAQEYLTFALQAGYTNMDKIESSPDLAELRNDGKYYYDEAIKNGLRGTADPKTMMWLQFRKQFPVLADNYQTKIKFSEDELENLTFISFDFERYVSEMRDEKFSRETSKGFYYVGTVYETSAYIAMLYIEKDEYGTEWYPVKYRLVTFNKDGKLIDKKTLAGSTGEPLEVKRATFFPGGNINVEFFQIEMEKDIDDVGYNENKIVGTALRGEEKFEISPEGKIVQVQTLDVATN